MGVRGKVDWAKGSYCRAACARFAALPLAILGFIGCAGKDGVNPHEDLGVSRQRAVGDPVRTVTLPPDFACTPHVGISVAVVPRAALGLSGDGALLASSCRSNAEGGTIYFIDPGSSDPSETPVAGTIVHTLTTDVVPPFGWGALAFRGDIVGSAGSPPTAPDLLACSNPASSDDPHEVYSVDLSTGLTTKLFEADIATPGLPFCDGMAWDQWNDTIYLSSDVTDTVYRYTAFGTPGTLLETVPVPPGCPNSGVEVVGPHLFLACNGVQTIYQVEQDGDVITSFPSGLGRAEDLECDRHTFGPDLSVIWTKDAFTPTLASFEVPPGTCGLCRSDLRPDLNALSVPDQEELAALLEEYLDGIVVGAHQINFGPWHTDPAFLPAHRSYIGGFEIWMLNVKGISKYVPMPKWNPANPVPPAFQGVDVAACTDAGGSASSCGPNTGSFDPMVPYPADFVYAGPPPTDTGLCAYSDVEALRTGGGGLTSLEGTYHNPVHGLVGGSGNFSGGLSPASLIFFPWHAHVDDVGLEFECKCNLSCPACTDVFQPFLPVAALTLGQGDAPETSAPIGFWWWFDDFVVPPEVRPATLIDHSGFNFAANTRGRPALVKGHVGQAIELDGRDDFVEVRDRRVGQVHGSDFTLDAWVKTSASGVQTIVDNRGRRGAGYALFLDDGHLGLNLGSRGHFQTFLAPDSPIADGDWHHVAAVVRRSELNASALYVDGARVLTFDATQSSNEATDEGLVIGGSERHRGKLHHHGHHHGHHDHAHHHHCRGGRHGHGHGRHRGRVGHLFEGQLDELTLVRSALTNDLIASIASAGTAGKATSVGNLPTRVEGPNCVTDLGNKIQAIPELAPLIPLYTEVEAALTDGRQGRARRRLRELRALALELAGPPPEMKDMPTMMFNVAASLANICLQQQRLVL